jgi:hypothetical protein
MDNNYLQVIQDLLELGSTDWVLGLSFVYLGISIVIEILHILFLFTPSKRDDAFIEQLKVKWESVSRYVSWLSIKTPTSAMLQKVLNMLGYLRDDLDKMKKK